MGPRILITVVTYTSSFAPGTVVVQPEAVLDCQPIYNGPEFRHNKKTHKVSCDLSVVVCSACNKQINPNTPGSAKRHPVLKVLICKVCMLST